ncbi:conserved hypothetical protein [Bradyrhizobium sp. ORS 375]|uniref:DUF2840 domain-containing protein n=1 Tax=Bradyrhizobium sp. (strain ORS 375) TaxID=566679 RepID=UPI000240968A|nr:DUF2840 domain-containing protein [Bradyrhizobium sp. ORS 375]CCD93371.1 conserved hypothetical protein [Bradyrhizobium sp. ORS 375]
MSELTRVQLLWLQGKIENRIRFGRTVQELRLDHYRREVAFKPGSVFAFVRWSSNGFGTVLSRISILQAVGPGEACATVPFVAPGAAILLQVFGWPKVERVLQQIDAVEALGIDPADVAPDHWWHVQNRMAAGQAPRPYTHLRHRAWLHRRTIMP